MVLCSSMGLPVSLDSVLYITGMTGHSHVWQLVNLQTFRNNEFLGGTFVSLLTPLSRFEGSWPGFFI